MVPLKVQEITCKSAIGKCGFPGGGWAINPYVGCSHNCVYCYARFIKRFTGHLEPWGSFVDARINIAEVLKKQLNSPKYKEGQVFIGTVTDPYQPLENKYQLTKQVLEVLLEHQLPVSILTKSDLVLRDLDLLRKFKSIDVNFTISTLDETWKKLTEPASSSVEKRLAAAKQLSESGIKVIAMMGPYWPIFTDPDELFKKFKEAGISHAYTESFNTTGGNYTEVGEILKQYYPEKQSEMAEILFNKERFDQFYNEEAKKVAELLKKYQIPTTIYFGQGHAAKFK